jgi:hypothetical protein
MAEGQPDAGEKPKSDYYAEGSSEAATETAIMLDRLETVRNISLDWILFTFTWDPVSQF